jgi:hypothetical protein
VLLAVGGTQMALDNQLQPIIAMGGLVLIVSATAISWELLVRVAQTRFGAGENDS